MQNLVDEIDDYNSNEGEKVTLPVPQPLDLKVKVLVPPADVPTELDGLSSESGSLQRGLTLSDVQANQGHNSIKPTLGMTHNFQQYTEFALHEPAAAFQQAIPGRLFSGRPDSGHRNTMRNDESNRP
jgi:hypothetical protein